MVLPILAYGSKVLKKKADNVDITDESLNKLIEDMFETMYNANGIGLAAPQIGVSKRIFVIDATPVINNANEDKEPKKTFIKTFLNAVMVSQSGEFWSYEEGCLSIPDINIGVKRKPEIEIKHQLHDGKWVTEKYNGLIARIIQHEYDHIEGVLFVDYMTTLKKRMLKKKLENIASGKTDTKYPMLFPI